MGENCQKPGRSVTKTGNSSTPETQVKPCNGCGLGVFQGRLLRMGGRRIQPLIIFNSTNAQRGSASSVKK
ncbi:hypothetical protein BVV10_10445 [Xanthomonas oryzae pv. oryzae]|nr:hypothetical protein BVV16_10425 [Xanthomonas oryzae pv. oryzae]AUI94170.1 hypothetical protein BVV17_10435 [Xanthomonas oryzae pv. oryzae]AUI97840.1 hypothetical protein BVV18_10440 [Xanthomonas oryzae pv. oryzae]AUJ01516.1 hypothetical protein BVV10_10445 [Xanthomonas oryzae pv. oryzae]AUJ05192.1 hypothetical protein BVV19_10455 [Xanthomonas oryzae pv. oryzae]